MNTDERTRLRLRELDLIRTEAEQRIKDALDIAWQFSQINGDHHKAWVIDQMVRILLADEYAAWINEYEHGEPNDYYEWDVGIAP